MTEDIDKVLDAITRLEKQKEKMTGQQYMDMMVTLKGLHAKWDRAHPGEFCDPKDYDKIPWGIKEFEAGKWYVCRLTKFNNDWTPKIKPIINGKPHKCVKVDDDGAAEFADVPGGTWDWNSGTGLSLKDFKEVPAPAGK